MFNDCRSKIFKKCLRVEIYLRIGFDFHLDYHLDFDFDEDLSADRDWDESGWSGHICEYI